MHERTFAAEGQPPPKPGPRRAFRPTLPATAIARLARAAWLATEGAGPFEPDRLDRRDPALIASVQPDLAELTRSWLGASIEGAEHLSREPCLYVGNHNGGIMGPDLFCTLELLWRVLGPDAPLYAMAHDFAMRHVQPLGRLLQRIGGLRAAQSNARRAFARGGSVLVYPGGDLDAYRRFDRRHRVVFGTRTGFIRLARDAGVPIVPIVAQGAHSSAVILHEGEWLARALGLTRWSRIQRFPIALALPWGIAPGPWLPYAPLPFPIKIRVLPRMAVPLGAPFERVRDEVVRRMQSAMDEMRASAAR